MSVQVSPTMSDARRCVARCSRQGVSPVIWFTLSFPELTATRPHWCCTETLAPLCCNLLREVCYRTSFAQVLDVTISDSGRVRARSPVRLHCGCVSLDSPSPGRIERHHPCCTALTHRPVQLGMYRTQAFLHAICAICFVCRLVPTRLGLDS